MSHVCTAAFSAKPSSEKGKTVATAEDGIALAIMQASVRQRVSQEGREQSRRARLGGSPCRVHRGVYSNENRRRSVRGADVGATAGDPDPTGLSSDSD
jgi:hypothetical protein